MNFKSIILSVLLLTLLAACGGAPATPPIPPTSAPTSEPTTTTVNPSGNAQPQVIATIAPTAQVVPSPSSLPPTGESPFIVRERPLDIGEPVLLFPTRNGLAFVHPDGTGKTFLGTGSPSFDFNLGSAFAPRDGLLAINIGDDPFTPDTEGCCVLTLNLMNVPSNTMRVITPLYSPEMEQALKTASTTGDRNEAVEAGIAIAENSNTLAWSPDGRYLAFIAAIDGPSSDVYSYDRESGQINRLTDGLNQAARLFWSPDSQWIIHEEVESFGTGAGWNVKAVWAAAPDGSGNRKLYDTEFSGDEVFVDWVSPDTFLVYSWTPIGLQNVRLVNLGTGAAQRIGPEFSVQALAFDPESQAQLTVVDDYTAQQNNLRAGLYLTAASNPPRLVAPGNWYDVRWLPHARMFFAKGDSGVRSVALDGTTTEYFGEGALPIDSPDGAWLLAWGDGYYTGPIGLRLYTTDGELKRAITTDSVTFATWSPDSNGVFYVSDGVLYYAAIPNGKPQLIEENLASTTSGSLGWITP
jgi:hypothetical protein